MMAGKLAWSRRAAWAIAMTALTFVACGDDEGDGGGTGATSSSATSGSGGSDATSSSGGGNPATGSGGAGTVGGGPASSSSGMGGSVTADCTPTGDACEDCVRKACCSQLGACAGADPTGCECWWLCQNDSAGTEPNPKCFDDCGPFSEQAQGLVQCTQNNCPECKQ